MHATTRPEACYESRPARCQSQIRGADDAGTALCGPASPEEWDLDRNLPVALPLVRTALTA